MSKKINYLPLAAIAAGVAVMAKKNSSVSGVGGTFSPNAKLNYVLQYIYDELAEMGPAEVRRYVREFPRESDCNIAQYGNLLIYYRDVRDLYERAGYKGASKWSDDKVWDIYLRQVGYVARTYFK